MRVDVSVKSGEVSLKLIPENNEDNRVLYDFPYPMKGTAIAGSYPDGSIGIIIR